LYTAKDKVESKKRSYWQVLLMQIKVKQSRYRPGVAQRVPGS